MAPSSSFAYIRPMLLQSAEQLPRSGDFIFQPKWDGYRGLVYVFPSHRVEIMSRNEKSLARYFPELVMELRALPVGTILDGEIVVATKGGLDFDALSSRIHPASRVVEERSRNFPASYVAFDLLRFGNTDFCRRPFRDRCDALQRLREKCSEYFQISPSTSNLRDAKAWLSRCRKLGFEGVVARRADRIYQAGKRTDAILKIRKRASLDCVVAGFTWSGALLLGIYAGTRFRIIGQTTYRSVDRTSIREMLLPLVRDRGSFERVWIPEGIREWKKAAETRWTPVHPSLVCEVAIDHFNGERLRHPARLLRWRVDLGGKDCKL